MNADGAVVESRGSGPDLVLFHGWAMHSGIWGRALDLLAEQFRLHLVDLPGHGRNRHQPWPDDWRRWNDAVRAQIPAPAWWMGWSLGGLFALDIAMRHTAHVHGVILVASNPCFVQRDTWPHGMAPEVFARFADDLAADFNSALERFLALEVHGSNNARDALRELRACAFAHGAPTLEALRGGLALLHDVDLSGDLRHLRVPLLALGGRRDRLVPPAAVTETAQRVPRGHRVSIPGAGHAPFIGHRDAFVQHVLEFTHDV